MAKYANAVQCEYGCVRPVYAVYNNRASTTSDGIQFMPAQFYDVAGTNIGILIKGPNGRQIGWAEKLFASASFAERRIAKIVKAYEEMSEENRMAFKVKYSFA